MMHAFGLSFSVSFYDEDVFHLSVVGSDSGERSSKIQVATSESNKPDGKNQQEVIHWHTRYS